MKSYLTEIFKEKGIEFFQTDRLSLDNYYYEPFQDSKEIFDENKIFETESGKIQELQPYYPSIFAFFLDGSRKPYKIGDMITTDNKFAPVVAGQIGAACCKRTNGKVELFKLLKRNVLMVFDSINNDDFEDIKRKLTKLRNCEIEVDKYVFDKMRDDAPTNAAVARIQKRMQDLEIDLLTDMANNGDLATDKMLVIDGSLQFLTQKFDPRIFYNVIGISKSFNPNLTGLLRGKKHIGVLLAKLKFGERTPVYRYETANNRYIIGAWYLRIRKPGKVRNALDGVIKVEKMAMQEEQENGFDSSMIDNISSSILGEIYPTCHGNDLRWNNHLYPIYLTEKVLKSKFFSDVHFMNIF